MSKTIIVLVALLCCGAAYPVEKISLLAETGVNATYGAYAVKVRRQRKPPEPGVCCEQCGKNGLPKGKVLSGDKQQVVDCLCPKTCKCKCQNGKCPK